MREGRERTACLLCRGATAPFFDDHDRAYLRCETCALVFVPPRQHPTPAEERERYLWHRNEADEGYVSHLRRLVDPLTARLRPKTRGLDFGCGPEPVLGRLLEDDGFPTASYDPLFRADEALLTTCYDFITCSEVLEHLRDPRETLGRLDALLAADGVLGVMTRLYDGVDFGSWWYRRDVTHVCFYAADTLRWIADWRGWRLERPSPDVTLFSRAGAPRG